SGRQGLHPRGNFEGFVRAASKDKWLEAHGIEHWTHFYTDYGVELQKRFFAYTLKGEQNGWDRQARVQLQVRHIDRFVERHENEWPIAHALDEIPPRPGRPRARFGIAKDRGERELRRAGRRRDVHFGAAWERDRDHGAARRETLRVFVDEGCRSIPGLPRVLSGYAGSGIHGRDRSSHAGRARLAARLAPQARSETLHRVPALPHARRAAGARARRGGAGRRRDLADLDRRPCRPQGGPDRAGKGLGVAEVDGRQALELQERVARLRA